MVILCQGEFKEVGGKSLSLSLCVSPRGFEKRNKPGYVLHPVTGPSVQ